MKNERCSIRLIATNTARFRQNPPIDQYEKAAFVNKTRLEQATQLRLGEVDALHHWLREKLVQFDRVALAAVHCIRWLQVVR